MEEDTYFELEFTLSLTEPFNFKENEILIIKNLIEGSRLNEKLSFYKVGMFYYDIEDLHHLHPRVELFDKFKRSKTNCICFKINKENNPNSYFDYLFVYETNNKENGFYGIVAYNKEFNKSIHIYGLNFNYTSLVVNMQRLVLRQK